MASPGLAAVYRDDPQLQPLMADGAPFEIVEVDVNGVSLRCYANGLASIIDSFRAGAAHSAKTHIVYGEERWTFAETTAAALSVARALRDTYEVGRRDRVAISMRNLPEYHVAFWAAAVLGAIVVPLNSWWTGAELATALDDAGAKVAVLDTERLDRVAGLTSAALVAVRTGSPPPGVAGFDDLRSLDPISEDDVVSPHTDDPVAILYTSGTTGRAKGAVMTHRNLTTNLMNMGFMGMRAGILAGASSARAPAPPAQPASLATGPLFHIGGVSAIVSAPMAGLKMVMLTGRWNVDEAIDLAIREQVTALGGVPAVARQLVEHPRFGELTMVRGMPFGGAAVAPDLPRRAAARVPGAQLMNGYGLTETTAAVVHNVGVEYAQRPDSVGRPNPTADLKVVDPDSGEELECGAVGELCVRSPQVAHGYWRNPDATAAAFVDGWFRTGDLGRIDFDGFVYVVDRLKDMVIRGGENVYCAEVEAALFDHPDVAEVAVIGIPEAAIGERVCVVVIARAGAAIELADLRAHAAPKLAAFKLPEAICVVREIPKTATDKVAKSLLREQVLAAGLDGRLW